MPFVKLFWRAKSPLRPAGAQHSCKSSRIVHSIQLFNSCVHTLCRHLSKKAKECLHQRKLFLDRAQLRLWSLRPELENSSKKRDPNLVPAVQFFRLHPTFPCSAPQLQAIINACMSMSEPVAPGKKYLQNATLHYLPEASWAVLRPLNERYTASSAGSSALLSASSPSAAAALLSPASTVATPNSAAGFTSPRQAPAHPLVLYVEIHTFPHRRPTAKDVTQKQPES
jgi:hypothetical protein